MHGERGGRLKAIVTDLDRTLLRSDQTLSDYTVRVLRQCHEKGFAVIAATARPERAVQAFHELVGFNAAVTLNGARVVLPGRVIENAIDWQSGEMILARLAALPGVLVSVETRGGLFSSAPIPEWAAAVYGGFPKIPPQGGALYKILASGGSSALYEKAKDYATEDTYQTLANNELVQYMSKEATKWNGIREILGAFGIRAQEAVYFGDDYDDVEPLKMCGLGVAVANANEAAKNAADQIAGACDRDGAARYIEQHILACL